MNTAYLSLGSNIGDRLAMLTEAVRLLSEHPAIAVKAVSSIYETDPVGYTDQEAFLNLALEIGTTLPASELLDVCQSIEEQLERKRIIRWGPRTIDLDILLYNQDNMETERLTVPHPRMHERAFVLVPLLEIAPQLKSRYPVQPDGVRLWKARRDLCAFLNDN